MRSTAGRTFQGQLFSRTSHTMPRFSIRQLLIATAFAAAGCFGLLNATALVAAAALSGVALLLSASVLLATYRDGERRAFWVGFAFLGWVYLFLCFGGILSSTGFDWRGNVTGQLALALYDRAYVTAAVQPAQYTSSSAYTPTYSTGMAPPGAPMAYPAMAPVIVQVSSGPDREQFLYVSHALWTMLFATCGGWFAQWLYATRTKEASQPNSA
jgi:hypothetical protein